MYSLVGVNGNAFNIVGYVSRAMRECKIPMEERRQYIDNAYSSNYDNLLRVSVQMLDKCNEIKGFEDELDEDDYDEEEDW